MMAKNQERLSTVFVRLFATPDGQRLLEWLDSFCFDGDINSHAELAWASGQMSIAFEIRTMMRRENNTENLR